MSKIAKESAHFSSRCAKMGTTRRLGWPLGLDDMQIHEGFHIKNKKEKEKLNKLK